VTVRHDLVAALRAHDLGLPPQPRWRPRHPVATARADDIGLGVGQWLTGAGGAFVKETATTEVRPSEQSGNNQ
jgi:hypothetical protein